MGKSDRTALHDDLTQSRVVSDDVEIVLSSMWVDVRARPHVRARTKSVIRLAGEIAHC